MDALKPWCTLKLTEEGLQLRLSMGETVIMQNKEGSTKANFTKSKLLKAEQKGHKDLLLSHPSLQTTENQPFAFFGVLLGNIMKLHEFKSNNLLVIEAKLNSDEKIPFRTDHSIYGNGTVLFRT
jgi:hypothetical protein